MKDRDITHASPPIIPIPGQDIQQILIVGTSRVMARHFSAHQAWRMPAWAKSRSHLGSGPFAPASRSANLARWTSRPRITGQSPPAARHGRHATFGARPLPDPRLSGGACRSAAHEWRDVAETYVNRRMRELGIPEARIGTSDPEYGIKRAAFMPHDREGGNITTGVTVNSVRPQPRFAEGREWRTSLAEGANIRDRIDAIIAHEWAEAHHVTHEAALKAAAKTELPITDGARRILRAMSR